MPAQVKVGSQAHWVRAMYVRVSGQPREVVKAWRKESTGLRLIYERVTDVNVAPVWPSKVTLGGAFQVTGTATDIKGLPVQSGTAYLEVRYQGATTWTRFPVGAPISNGQFTITAPVTDYGGTVSYRVWVDVNPPLLDSASSTWTTTVAIGTPTGFQGGTTTHTSAQFSWTAVPGASGYEVRRDPSDTLVATVTSPSSGTMSTAANTQYNFRVRAFKTMPDGSKVFGPYSTYFYLATGRPEQRDQGAATVHVGCVNSGSHRNDTGWGQPYVRQGYFSTPYGGAGYVGIFDYGDWGVANAIISALGRSRYDNGWCSRSFTRIYKRGDVGNRSCCPVNFYTGTSYVGGPRPGLYRHVASPTLCYNSWHQIELGPDAGNDLARQAAGCRNIGIYAGNSTDYAALNNHTAGVEDGDFWLDWNWNFVSVSYVAPRWWA